MTACLVALDFDGTLSPLVRRPQAAKLPTRTRRLLLRLSRLPGVRLAFVSGRALADLSKRVRVPGAFYSGNHGLEIRGPGLAWSHPGATVPELRRAARDLRRVCELFPGTLLEDKRLTLAFHYRGMAAGAVPALRAALRRALSPYRLELRGGKKTFEVRPRVAWNKGDAVLKIARAANAGRRIVFVGDDRTDEDVFALLRPRGVTVKVGPGPTAARFRVRRQEDVVGLLEFLCREVLIDSPR